MSATPLFSVIIPAKNEERHIGSCLAALAALDLPASQFEVIVVDNGSTDRTPEIAESWADRLNICLLCHPTGTISALRNAGAQCSRGEHLAFLDADCLPPERWLSDSLEIFRDGTPGINGGFYANPADASWVANVWYGEEVERKQGLVSYVPSGNLLLRRADFFDIGGFDEALVTNEDYEFCQRAIATGYPVHSWRKLAVVHLGAPGSVGHFYRKQRWHGKHVARVFLSSLPKIRNAAPIAFAAYTLFCLAGVLAGIVFGLLTGNWAVFLVSVCALVAAPLALAANKTLKTGRAADLFPFALLFLVFGTARALCLLNPGAKPATAAATAIQTEKKAKVWEQVR